MLVFNKHFYKNKKSKLYFGDRVAVLNDFIYQTGGSIYIHMGSGFLYTTGTYVMHLQCITTLECGDLLSLTLVPIHF
jgi:hypothetical protein